MLDLAAAENNRPTLVGQTKRNNLSVDLLQP